MPSLPYIFRDLGQVADYLDERADELVVWSMGKGSGAKSALAACAERRRIADLLRNTQIVPNLDAALMAPADEAIRLAKEHASVAMIFAEAADMLRNLTLETTK